MTFIFFIFLSVFSFENFVGLLERPEERTANCDEDTHNYPDYAGVLAQQDTEKMEESFRNSLSDPNNKDRKSNGGTSVQF